MNKINNNPSPNLLREPEETLAGKYQPHVISVSKIVIILTQAVFIILLGLNSKVVYTNAQKVKYINELGATLLSLSNSESEVRDVLKRTGILKNVMQINSASNLPKKIEATFNNISPNVFLLSARVDTSKANLSLAAPSALSVSTMMARYLSIPEVKELVLNSASLNTTTGGYMVQIDLVF
jgi:hypothetical protein